MAIVSLADIQRRTQFFQKTARVNITYWLNWLGRAVETDISSFDDERANVIKAILFGLRSGKSMWSTTYQLVEAYSPYMERRGHWEVWQQILTQTLQLAETVEDTPARTNLLVLLARLMSRQSDLKQTRHYYRRIIRLARTNQDRYNEARACSNLGYYYTGQGNWLRAELLCCHALQIFEALDSNHGRAHTENHLGVLYTRQGSWDKAEDHLQRACQLWQEVNDEHGLMLGYLNLGSLFIEQEKPEQAMFNLEKAFCQAKLVGEEAFQGTIYLNLGCAYRLMGQFLQAELDLRQAQTIFKQFSDTIGMALVQDNLGMIYTEQQKWQEAELSLQQALQTWRRLDHKHNEIRVLTYLIEYEMAKGNPRQASGWLREAEDHLDHSGSMVFYQNLYAKVEELRHNLAPT